MLYQKRYGGYIKNDMAKIGAYKIRIHARVFNYICNFLNRNKNRFFELNEIKKLVKKWDDF